jgi:hypothetical protein
MSHIIIYDQQSRAVLVIDPSTDEHGDPVLPEGVDAAVAEIDDTEAAKFGKDGSYTLDVDGQTIDFTAAPPPPPPPPPPPNIEGLVSALLQAPELSQSTKNQLIAALQGQPPPVPVAASQLRRSRQRKSG